MLEGVRCVESKDIYFMIKKIIHEQTIFLRHYVGKVVDNNDPKKLGRLKITIPEIGFDTPDLAKWAYPRQGAGMSIPNISDWAEIYFIGGDPNRPVYLFPASEISGMTPKGYSGGTNTRIIFESSKTKDNIKYDDIKKSLTFLNGEEPFVLGDKLKDELQKINDALTQLKTDFTSWVPVPLDGGAALKAVLSGGFLTKPLAVLDEILSEKIKGK